MNPITQPATITDMRRNPKGILRRIKKEKVVPILTHSKYEAAFISIDELDRIQEELKDLRHELFVQETLESSRQVERGEFSGPFDTVEDLMRHLNRKVNENN
ncbi:type II toxin-antitoxin system prevent-host-death family antitoxin [Candidatus Peregrinibacteria bacterium]|nr:type II toxin-antitoxin system prevent-host-death family antitoxin [Candidatus Peregrinibacteria bacterium]